MIVRAPLCQLPVSVPALHSLTVVARGRSAQWQAPNESHLFVIGERADAHHRNSMSVSLARDDR